MTDRQQQLLKHLVDIYIETAEPVSSRTLVEVSGLSVSSATVRNDLAALEENGYVMSPHTSAGRIPTEKGYRFYIEWFVERKEDTRPVLRKRFEQEVARANHHDLRIRRLAQLLSELSGQVVILAPAPDQSYATGMSRLLQKPEFHDHEMVQRLGEIMDGHEELLQPYYKDKGDDVNVMLGEDNPFGKQMTTMTVTYRKQDGTNGVISIVGPTRMNYQQNMALLREVRRLIDNEDI